MTRYLTPKKFQDLPDDKKAGWFAEYKEYATETKQEMQYCDCCGQETGIEEVTTRTPVGEPYRYAWSVFSELAAYYDKRFLERATTPPNDYHIRQEAANRQAIA